LSELNNFFLNFFDNHESELKVVTGSAGFKEKNYYRFDLFAGHARWLEYVTARALRARLAGLARFARSFCKRSADCGISAN